ncbi:hypothetical protein ColKHC_06222 [Colletotrichum higginsianum]|nr:hypothetical protein ColKHC_06222 [Colletotrichum higginsianum]
MVVPPPSAVGKIVVSGTGPVAVKVVEASSNRTSETANDAVEEAVVLRSVTGLASEELVVVEAGSSSDEVLRAVLVISVFESVEVEAELSLVVRMDAVEGSAVDVLSGRLESADEEVVVSEDEDCVSTELVVVSNRLVISEEDEGASVGSSEVETPVVEVSEELGDVVSLGSSVEVAVDVSVPLDTMSEVVELSTVDADVVSVDTSEVEEELVSSVEDVTDVVVDAEPKESVEESVVDNGSEELAAVDVLVSDTWVARSTEDDDSEEESASEVVVDVP